MSSIQIKYLYSNNLQFILLQFSEYKLLNTMGYMSSTKTLRVGRVKFKLVLANKL